MINTPNNNNNHIINGIMEPYDDRPISMYDNLNNMTTNMNATTVAMNSSSTPKMTKAPTMATTATTNGNNANGTTVTTTAAVVTTPTSSKTNGAAHSTPFTDITFKFNNDNNNITQQQQQKLQQLEINGNRNLNEIGTNTGNVNNTNNTAVYATPYKTTAPIKPLITTASSPTPLTAQQQQHSPSIATAATTITNTLPNAAIETTTTTETSKPTAAPSLYTTAAVAEPVTATAAVTINSDTFNNCNRPLSQHSQSELNDTSHSIAAVKAALNEAKSKFFGLNGYASSPLEQQQQQLQDQQQLYNYNNDNYGEESPNHQLLPTEIHHQYLPHQQQVQKPQPKYQNIPENSAIFRNLTADLPPPELPPKPIEYQNLQQPSNRNIHSTTPDHNRKMPSSGGGSPTNYNQISLNDIDGPTSRSQVSVSI